MPGPSVKQRIRYRFDNFMARGGRSIFASLLVVFLAVLVLLVVIRLIVELFVPEASASGWGWSTFVTFLQLTDPGSMAEDSVSSGWYRAIAITAGIVGIVLLAALIAFITTEVERRLHQLRKGHSQVVEEGHTLVLGWEEQRVAEIARELIVANESVSHRAVVILADEDKEYMDDYLSKVISDAGTTTLVTRSGSPASPLNLQLSAVDTASSAIILAGCPESASREVKEESDARVVKALLALLSRAGPDREFHVVVEVFDPDIRALIDRMTGEDVVALDARDFLSRILVQTSRSLGLSVVYDELLSFSGNEIYFFDGPFAGLTFGEVGLRYPQAIPVGVRGADGEVEINPSPDRVLQGEDRLLVIAEDDSTITFSESPVVEPRATGMVGERQEPATERYLIVGRTPRSPLVLAELSEYVLPGSHVDIIPRGHHPAESNELRPLQGDVDGLVVSTLDLDPLSPETWDRVEPASYNSIILLSEGDELRQPDQIDAETILILMLIRSALGDQGAESTTVITELVESENQALAASTGVHDFVISSRLVSMLLAQVSEEPDMHLVYERLFDEAGSEIYLKPASLYLPLPADIGFADLLGPAVERGEICVGVKIAADEHRPDRNYGIRVAPPKVERFHLSPGDRLIVIAEDDT